MNANIQAAVAAGAPALAALLRAANPAQLEHCSIAARDLLRSFLVPFMLAEALRKDLHPAPLLEKFWQRVTERPSALVATVEAIQLCRVTDDMRADDLCLVDKVSNCSTVSYGFAPAPPSAAR